jgi:hypothetical protein
MLKESMLPVNKSLRKIYRLIIAVCILIAASGNHLEAQDAGYIQTDRPSFSNSVSTVPPQFFQAENGFQVQREGDNSLSWLLPTMLFKTGITNRLEFRLDADLSSRLTYAGQRAGISPVAAGFKLNVFKGKGILPAFSVLGELTSKGICTGGLGNKLAAPAFKLLMTNRVNDDFSVSWNTGIVWNGQTKNPVAIYTLCLDYEVSEITGVFAELYGFFPSDQPSAHGIDGGFTLLPKPDLYFDLSGGVRLTEGLPRFFAAAGASWRIKFMEKKK